MSNVDDSDRSDSDNSDIAENLLDTIGHKRKRGGSVDKKQRDKPPCRCSQCRRFGHHDLAPPLPRGANVEPTRKRRKPAPPVVKNKPFQEMLDAKDYSENDLLDMVNTVLDGKKFDDSSDRIVLDCDDMEAFDERGKRVELGDTFEKPPARPMPGAGQDSGENPATSKLEPNSTGQCVGYNLYNANPLDEKLVQKGLRPVIIDGSNLAISHAKGKAFSVRGLDICISYFVKRGHRVIAFVPLYRKERGQSTDYALLLKLEEQGTVIFTPSRVVDSKIRASHEDRYIVQCAAELGGVIVTMDKFRDVLAENPLWAKTIEDRVLMFTWVDDILIFPLDPLGRGGPELDVFLRF